MCPIFQVSNVSGENLDLLKMFLNLLSTRLKFRENEPAEFQIDDTFSVPVSIFEMFINPLCGELIDFWKLRWHEYS